VRAALQDSVPALGLINVAIWLSLTWLLRRMLRRARRAGVSCALVAVCAAGRGAVSRAVVHRPAAGVYADFHLLKNGRDFRAGAILGLGLFKFQFIVPFALIFLLRRRWKFMRGFVATAAGWVCCPSSPSDGGDLELHSFTGKHRRPSG